MVYDTLHGLTMRNNSVLCRFTAEKVERYAAQGQILHYRPE